MPLERRRQRQQRVRHEAGDYALSCPKEDSEPRETHQRKSTRYAEETMKPDEPHAREEVTSRTVTHLQEKNGVMSREERTRRPDHYRKEERRRDFDKGRGRRDPATGNHRRLPNTSRPQDTNVAVAEEQPEYEPVRIMESKEDTLKDGGELPQPPKYRRQEVISNWLRYEEMPAEDDEPLDGEDYLLGEDFSHVISGSGNASTGGFLHLRGEMSWGTPDVSQLDRHGLGALKVADLLAALATIPLHEQLKISEDALPAWTISTMKAGAERNRRNFRPDREYVTDLEVNLKVLESLKLGLEVPGGEQDEEEESTGHDAVGAALKLSSSAEGHESDVEVDLHDLVRENESLSRKSIQENSPPPRVSPTSIAERIGEHQAENGGETDFSNLHMSTAPKPQSQPVLPQSSGSFDFGLPKATGDGRSNPQPPQPQPPQRTGKHDQHQVVEPNQCKEPTIDLDYPTTTAKPFPVLVSKTEVENLEDWLDSVLED